MKKLFFFLGIALFFLACDESTEPGPIGKKNYLPLAIGNYWVYRTYEIDPNQQLVPGTVNIDSVVIESTYEYKSLLAYKAVVFRNGTRMDTLVYAQWKEEIHRLYNAVLADIPFMPDTWFRIADNVAQKWHIYNTSRINIDFNFFGDTVKVNADYTYNGELSGEEYIPIDTNNVFCTKFVIKPDRRYMFKHIFRELTPPETSNIIVTSKQIETRWFSNKIGIVRYQQDPYAFIYKPDPPVSSFAGKTEFKNGFVKELLRFGLKQ